MRFAITIDSETNRIKVATFKQFASDDQIIVDELPIGDITEYLFINGEYVYSPKPSKPAQEPPKNEDRIKELEDELAAMKALLLQLTEGKAWSAHSIYFGSSPHRQALECSSSPCL